jgi:two-component system sensor histidine kinase BaeS
MVHDFPEIVKIGLNRAPLNIDKISMNTRQAFGFEFESEVPPAKHKRSMRLGITSKMFLVVLATSAVIIVVMSIAVRISFEHGFLNYLNSEDIDRATKFTVTLGDSYREHGDWEWLRGNPRHWTQLVLEKFSPPFRRNEAVSTLSQQLSGPPPDTFVLVARLTLKDENDNFVAGNPFPADDVARRPVIVDGNTVGWLLISPYKTLTDTVALSFQEQQRKAVFAIAGIVAALATLVAILLSRNLLSPVKQLARGTRALAAGDYNQSLSVTSSDELGQLAKDFNVLSKTLQKNDQARRQWIADISHELRTPLAVLRGEIEAMQDGIQPLCPNGMKSLHMEVMMLSKIVEDLYELSMSDVGALNYRKERVNVLDVAAQALTGYTEEFRRKGITIESKLNGKDSAFVFADEARLGQLFSNLLQNAIRYTDSGGRLRVSSERKNGDVTVDLQDTEPGVPTAALPHLFERLYRVEGSRSRESGGAGLGLAICKNIVEAHNGTIEARPSPLGGLWIRVTLPLQA